MPLNYGDAIPIAEFHRPLPSPAERARGRLRFYAKSGGVASVTNAFTASSSVIIVFAWLPSRRMLTVLLRLALAERQDHRHLGNYGDAISIAVVLCLRSTTCSRQQTRRWRRKAKFTLRHSPQPHLAEAGTVTTAYAYPRWAPLRSARMGPSAISHRSRCRTPAALR